MSVAEEVPADFVERFRAITASTECDAIPYECHHFSCADEPALRALLLELCRYLAGADWFQSPAVIEACDEAGLDYEALLRVPPSASDNAAADLDRKETGDLGEVLSVLHMLAHHGADARFLFAKNVLKRYERISEPGIDVIQVRLSASRSGPLNDDEGLTLVEAKASEDQPIAVLASAAVDSLSLITEHRLQKELLMIQSEMRGRGDTVERLPLLLSAFISGSRRVEAHGILISSASVGDPHGKQVVTDYNTERQMRVSHLSIDVATARQAAFVYRREPT